eukprot:2235197-Rhodomonas_salina.1
MDMPARQEVLHHLPARPAPLPARQASHSASRATRARSRPDQKLPCATRARRASTVRKGRRRR